MRVIMFAAAMLAAAPARAANYAIINGSGAVDNVITWDGASPYTPPAGDTIQPLTGSAGIGWSYASGTFTAPAAPTPAPVCAITSTGTSAISGSYAPPDATAQGQIAAVTLYTQVNPGKFPGGAAVFPWPDSGGAAHVFSTSTTWLSFASAMADCTMAYATGQTTFAETIP